MNQPRHRGVKWLFLKLFPAKVTGLHYVPGEGAVIIASNHNSPLDGVYLWATLRRNIFFLVILKVFFLPLLGWYMRWSGQIPVDQTDRYGRTNLCSGALALREAEGVLNRGGVVGICPEGKCNDEGQMSRFKPGVTRLALATGTPIVPVGIRGSSKVMEDLGQWPRLFRPVQLTFGEPIHVDGRANTSENRRWLHATLEQAIAELSGQRPYRTEAIAALDTTH